MKKYRIKEYIKADGRSFFEIQERILFFWFDYDGFMCHFETKEKAEEAIATMESNIIIKTKIHE
jgi:hypothetical protein